MKRIISVLLALILSLSLVACGSNNTNETVPPQSEQATNEIPEDSNTPAAPEDKQEEQPVEQEKEEIPVTTPEPTPEVVPTPDPEPAPEQTETPEPAQTVEPTPEQTVTPKPELTPEVTPEPSPSVEPAPEQTETPEVVAPTPEPEFTIDISSGSTTPEEVPEEDTGVEAPGVEISGVSWVEGQSHTKPKAGDVVMKADGTKVTLKNVKVGNITVLGYGQGVDIYTGTTINGRVVKEGNPHWDDSSPFQKCSATGEMYSKNTWQTIANQTNPTNKYVGDYDGEIYQTYWQWDADAYNFNTGENTGRWVWLGEG